MIDQTKLDSIVLDLLKGARNVLTALPPGVPSFFNVLIGAARRGHTVEIIQRDLAQVTSAAAAPQFVRELEAQYHFEWLAHVADAWVKRHNKADGPIALPLRPAGSYPDRQDALVVEAKAGKLFRSAAQIYTRDALGKLVFEELRMHEPDRAFSRLLGVGSIDLTKDPFKQ